MKIEKLYKDYLRLVNLDERRMTAIQRQEIRRAFWGGISSLFKHLIMEIEDDELTEEFLNDIHEQCKAFWQKEMIRHQQKNN
jgi:hypothetical protein